MPHPSSAKKRQTRHFKPSGVAILHCFPNFRGKRRRNALVGIEQQNPITGRVRQCDILLSAMIGPRVMINRCAVLLGDGNCVVLAAAVYHNSFVTELQAVDTVRNIGGFITGNRDRAQRWHIRFLSNKLASVPNRRSGKLNSIGAVSAPHHSLGSFGLSSRFERPAEALMPVVPSTDHGCRATEFAEPPSRKLPPSELVVAKTSKLIVMRIVRCIVAPLFKRNELSRPNHRTGN